MKIFSALSFIFLSLSTFSQTASKHTSLPGIHHRGCGTMEALEQQLKKDPRSEDVMKEIERQTEEWIRTNDASRGSRAVINIPVVFHVVYQNTAENISDALLMDQLRVLNEDLNKTHADTGKIPAVWKSIAADCEINLCLAQRDPAGNPTTGITRTLTGDATFSTNNQIKYNSQGGKDAWDRNQYLNIWVGDLGASLLGYAQFPGGAAATDGVVIHYKFTGTGGATFPYDKGRTLTHELGHWLNLYHIWGDDGTGCTGSDQVTDTPNQSSEHYGCYAAGSVQTDGCSPSAPGTMWQNYMDYTDDACMYMFTQGQKARMHALLTGTGFRASLATSLGCTPVAVRDAAITAISNPSSGNCNTSFAPVVTLTNKGVNTLTSATINYNVDGGTNSTFSWTGSLVTGASVNVTLPTVTTTAGNHNFNAFTSVPNGGTDLLTANDSWAQAFAIIASTTPLTLPFTEGFQTAGFPPANWTLINGGAANTWTKASVGGFGTSNASTKMDNFTGTINITGQTDDLISPAISLSAANSTLKMKFAVGYARYSDAYYDSLFIEISSDCGNTWSRVYGKGGIDLQTKVPQTTAFTPTAAQWRTDSVMIGSYAGLNDVRFRFRNLSGSGNNLYIDDINLSYTASPPVANLSGTPTTICAGQSVTFTDLSTNTPTSWSWSFTGLAALSSTVKNPTITFTTAGIYNVSLIATNNSGSDTVVKTSYITVNEIPATPTAGSNSPICVGSTLNLTSNTIAGATYSWTGPGGFTSTLEDPTSTGATTAMSGTYSVTRTVNGCTSAAGTTSVTVNPIPTAPTAGNNGPVCMGQTLNLTSNTITGATYNWTGTNGFTSSLEDPSITSATTAASGTYSVTATVSGCTSSSGTTSVTINTAPTVGGVTETCNGTNTAYTVTFTISGGDPASYTVTPAGSGTISGSTFTSNLITSGTGYSFTVNDVNNCNPVVISGSKSCSCITFSGTMNATPITLCENEAAIATHNGDEMFDADDAIMFVLHSGSGNSLGTIYATNSTPSFNFSSAPLTYGTTYYISAVVGNSDGSGGVDFSDPCLSVTSGTPTTFTAISVSGSQTDITCNGSNDGTISVIATDGAAPYSYLWNTSDTTSSIANRGAGAYTVTVSDANGCSTSAAYTINEPTVVTAIVTSQTNVTVNGGNDGALIAAASGGTSPYTYSINGGSFSGLAAGTYTITVTDANGCTGTVNVIITQPGPITSGTPVVINAGCNGCCNGSITLAISGGATPYTYSWTNTTALGDNADSLCAGTYIACVTDANSNTVCDTIIITQPTAPDLDTIIVVNAGCATCCNGTIDIVASGGAAPYTYNWLSDPSNTNSSADSLCPGTYVVCVSDTNGSQVCDTVTISAPSGIDETSLGGNFSVYPNPTRNSVTVDILTSESGNAVISFFDIIGQQVLQENISLNNSLKKNYSVENFAPGIYFITVKTGSGTITKKFVKN